MFFRYFNNFLYEINITAVQISIGNLNRKWTIILIIAAAALVLLLTVFLLSRRRRKGGEGSDGYFGMSIAELNDKLEPFGFACMEEQNVFYSIKNAWQRKHGYCRLFDEAAAPLSMIIDCEPIYFEYNKKYWLIEFWKGQYGMTTGAEVGIYNIDKEDKEIDDFDMVHFKSAQNSEMLPMSFTLFRNKKPIMRRNDRHWWLTGFLLGEFSQPEELSLRVNIAFNGYIQRNAFLQGLAQAGYTQSEYSVTKTIVSIFFDKPHTFQPISRTAFTDRLTQMKNRELCRAYKRITDKYPTMPQKLNALYSEDSRLLDRALQMGKQQDFFGSFERDSGER